MIRSVEKSLLFSLIYGFIFANSQLVCPYNGKYISSIGKCLQFYRSNVTFQTAEDICTSNGGHLPSVISPQQDFDIANAASNYLYANTEFWIGLIATDSYYNATYGWHFTDGAPFGNYTNWAQHEPSYHSSRPTCAVMKTSSGGGAWTTYYCGTSSQAEKRPFGCAYPPLNAPPPASCPTLPPQTTYNPPNTTSYCTPGYIYWNGYCYKSYEAHSNLAGLDNSCLLMSPYQNGHIASIKSEAENFLIASLVYPKPVLLGLTYESKSWWNMDGTPVNYTKWYQNQPNKIGVYNCVKSLQNDYDLTYEWSTIVCDIDTYIYVCKYPAMF